MTEEIRALAESIQPQMVEWRRHFHRHPELGFQEKETAAFIAGVLKELGYQVQTGVVETGVVGVLLGRQGHGRTVALRADMDALPVQEASDGAAVSQNPGVMHACGHDLHMATMLGAAAMLAKLKDKFPGAVKMIFQPAEEGPGGAEPMIEQGVLKNPPVDFILGGHVWPGVPVGSIAVQAGPVMAASDTWYLSIKGRGGHGAQPHLCIDPIAIGAEVVSTLQQIVSRTNNPQDPVVLTVGQFNGGTRHNIIANEVTMSGTLRTFSELNRDRIPPLMEAIIAGICTPFGAEYDLEIQRGYPATVNHERLTELLIASARTVLGEPNVITKLEPAMPAEDFSYFANAVPGVYLRLGISDGVKGIYPLHHNQFDANEEALKTGAMVFVQTALDLILQGQQ